MSGGVIRYGHATCGQMVLTRLLRPGEHRNAVARSSAVMRFDGKIPRPFTPVGGFVHCSRCWEGVELKNLVELDF